MLEPEIMMEQGPQCIPGLTEKRQLLVVDDNEAIQKLLSKALTFMGYDVTLAGNGLEACTLFLTRSYDLVMTDIQMPLMNGWELSRFIKERSSNTPVIVMTGFYDGEQCEKLSMSCVDAIILKSFKLEEIEKSIQRLLNSGRYGRG